MPSAWAVTPASAPVRLASAATVDLCDYGGSLTPQNYVTITGSTSIVSFGASCQVGQIKWVGFAGTLVVTYSSSNILTPTGQSITTANGDQAQLLYLGGGVWRILSYETVGGNVPVDLGAVLTAMLGWHTVIGLGEAVITGLVVAAVVATRPDLVHGARPLLVERELEVRTGVAS